jgi:hypothetical protein
VATGRAEALESSSGRRAVETLLASSVGDLAVLLPHDSTDKREAADNGALGEGADLLQLPCTAGSWADFQV